MLRIAVCDDIPYYVEKMADMIESWAEERRIDVQLKKFMSGEEVLFDLEGEGSFAAVFMDIELGGIDGMEAALKVREQNRIVSIVFVSQHEKYFKQMFRVYPFQYIEKPLSSQKVHEVMDKIVLEHKLFYESFFFRYKRITFNITLWEVLYFVSDKRRIRILLEKGREYVFYEKLDALERKLSYYNNCFIRIHQSYLVNDRHVEEFHPRYVVMRNGDELPVSREKRCEIGRLHMKVMDVLAKG